MSRGLRHLLLIPIALFMCTGCWDTLPATGIANVIAVGVSSGKTPGTLTWTFILPNVTITATNLVNVGPGAAYKAFSIARPSLAAAVDVLQSRLSRRVYLGQVQAVMWSDSFGTARVRQILDSFSQWGAVANDFWVATGADPLTDWLLASPRSQVVVPQYELSNLFDCRCLPMKLGVKGWRLWSRLHTPGDAGVVPWVTRPLDTVTQVVVYPPEGKPYLMSPTETRGWAFLTGRMRSGTMTVTTPQGDISTVNLHGGTAVDVRRSGSALLVHAKVRVAGRVVQVPWKWSLGEAFRTVGGQVLLDCRAALGRAERTGTDPFGWTARTDWPRAVGKGPPAPAPWRRMQVSLDVLEPALQHD